MAAGTATVLVCTVGGVTLYSGGSVITHVSSLVEVTNGLTCSVVIDSYDLSRCFIYARGALSTGTVTLKLVPGDNYISGNLAQKTVSLVSEASAIIGGLESSRWKGDTYFSIVPTGGSAIIGVLYIPKG